METLFPTPTTTPIVTPQFCHGSSKLESFRLRYRVFCKEKEFFDQQSCQGGRETDPYDCRALHIMVTRPLSNTKQSEEIIATTRVIPHTKRGLPTEKFCNNLYSLVPDDIPHKKIAEISRLCVAQEHRIRSTPRDGKNLTLENTPIPALCSPVMTLLFKGIYIAAKELEAHYIIAAMESSLARILLKNGITMNPLIDEWINYYGKVKIYGSTIRDILNGLQKNSPEIYEFIRSPLAPGNKIQPHLHLLNADSRKIIHERIGLR